MEETDVWAIHACSYKASTMHFPVDNKCMWLISFNQAFSDRQYIHVIEKL